MTHTSNADAVLSRFDRLKQTGDGQYESRCPAHDDQTNSLCIAVATDGTVLLKCQAGCETSTVLQAVGLEFKDLFSGNGSTRRGKSRGKIVATYPYCDEQGTLLYESVRFEPKDFRQRAPDGNGGHVWKVNGVRRAPYRLPELQAADTSETVLIVEGEKDVDRLRSLGFVATCNAGGAGKWTKKLSEHLKGRHCVLCGDNDEPGNKHVDKVGASLQGMAATVRVLELPDLPEHGDVSDWLDNGGTAAELRRLIDVAQEWTPPEKSETDDEVNEDVTDPHRLARLCLAQMSVVRFWRQEFYRFDRPAYRVLADDEIRAEIAALVKAEFDRVNRFAKEQAEKEGEPVPKAHKVTRSLIGNVLQALQSISIISYRDDQPVWLDGDGPFPAHECFVTRCEIIWPRGLMTGKPHSHKLTAKLFTTNAVGYQFDPAADCPTWRKFLDSLWSNDPELIETLQEIMGYLLLPDTSQQKMFMLIGPKRSGKGTIARAIRGLVGPDNCCAPVLGSLQGDFGLQPLLGKTVGIIGDARLSGRSDEAIIVERLLSITGEDAQTVNRKHRQAVTTQLKTRFLLISNELPRLRDASATLPSRVILLRMTKSFYGREDHGLTDKILAELPGILQWALLGYQRLLERGYFVQPESSRELLGAMEELSSPVIAFVNQCCQVGPGFQVSVKELFGAWKTWSDEKGRKPGNEQSFGRDLRAAVPTIRVTQPRIEGKQQRFYEGIKVNDT